MNTYAEAENLDKKRSQWIAINLIGFIIWDGMRILGNYFIHGEVHPLLFITEIIGWLIWTISLIWIIRTSKRINKDENLKTVLNDEYVVVSRLKSWRAGFISILITQVVILLIALTVTISGQLSAEISIFVGVGSAMLSFIVYHR